MKLKPEYIEGLGDDLDLLIVGAFFFVGSLSETKVDFLELGLEEEEELFLTSYLLLQRRLTKKNKPKVLPESEHSSNLG